jgi:uridine phosphorylase
MSQKGHHILLGAEHTAGNGGLGRSFLVPGSPGRAEMIASLFDEVDDTVITPRRNDTYLGKVRLASGLLLDVGATASGMGPGSTEIIVNELVEAGARRLVRVGTSGSVQHERVRIGCFVIATGAVRDEMASRHWAPLEVPAVAHPDTVLAYERAAFRMGLADKTFRGLVHTKASLYARAVFKGPLAEQNATYKETMIRSGVVSSEMEASVMFVLGQTLGGPALSLAEERSGRAGGVKMGTVLGIIGGKDAWGTPEELARIEHETCVWGLEGLKELNAIDRLEGCAV